MKRRSGFALLAGVALAVAAHPALAAPPLAAPAVAAGVETVAKVTAVPRRHPRRTPVAAPAPAALAAPAAPAPATAAPQPFPSDRFNIVGRVEDGRVVPVSPTAFAARAESGPVASLFRAAEAASAGEAPARGEVRAAAPAGAAPARGEVRAAAPAGAAPSRAEVRAAASAGEAPARGEVRAAAASAGETPLRAEAAPVQQPVRTAAVGPGITTPLVAAHGTASGEKAFERYGRQSSSLKGALDALKADRYADAVARRNALSDPIDRKIVDYFLIRSSAPIVNSAMVADFAARADGWPSPASLRARAEEALSRERPDADTVIRSMGGAAQSPAGVRLLAKALIAKGDRARALQLVRAEWYGRALGAGQQDGYLDDFGPFLTVDDHLTRVDKLIALEKFEEARALRARLGAGPRAYLDARLAAADGEGSRPMLDRVPAEYRSRPGFRLAELELLRHAEDWDAAARLIEGARAGSVDGDAWWVETRIVARALAERGDGRRAYALVAKGFAQDDDERADEAFHAGWFALAHLKDGRAAGRHFAELEKIATTPISLARAGYWRGRAAELSGDRGGARKHYSDAARFGFTYYGQISRATLGIGGTDVGRAAQPTAADRAAFARNEVAESVRRLIAAGHASRIVPLVDWLSETVPSAGQVSLAAELARKAGYPHIALMAAKEGQRRGLPVGGLAYPTSEIPNNFPVPAGLDRAVVYAIARQESEFNAGAQSPAGARGLMQVMPQTAAAMARELGIPHSLGMLTSDPRHNATLGAAYLKKRLGDFDGSFILTFAAYNAGAGKVKQWVQRFGDPRDPRVDPVQWVESIPYPETRNYVMRVMENVQVYREELGTGRLAIESDLKRGRQS